MPASAARAVTDIAHAIDRTVQPRRRSRFAFHIGDGDEPAGLQHAVGFFKERGLAFDMMKAGKIAHSINALICKRERIHSADNA
jgi:hypothetical protein